MCPLNSERKKSPAVRRRSTEQEEERAPPLRTEAFPAASGVDVVVDFELQLVHDLERGGRGIQLQQQSGGLERERGATA